MTLHERLSEYVRACFSGIWIESHEHEDALREIASLCRQQDWRLAVWDIDRGLASGESGAEQTTTGHDPLAAVRAIEGMATPDGVAILVLVNFHRFLQSAEIVQTLSRQITVGKVNRTIVVILAPTVQIPLELEKLLVVIEHELPNRPQLAEIAHSIATEPGELPQDAELESVLDAAGGLTRYEAESAFCLSLVRHGRVTPEAIWELKSGMLKKSGLLQLHRGQENFNSLAGLASLKAFCKRSLRPQQNRQPGQQPRGVLLLGVPGAGKSAFAKALGRETGRPTLLMDVGALMGSLVGQTEGNLRQALRIADAMAPVILFVDEVEKALSGVSSSGNTDSGVTARLFGSLLSWMNDHTTDVYLVATCNDIAKLPPEFARAERFDGIFFFDLPGREEKDAVWQIYQQQFALPDQPRPDDASWTPAEIKACCRLAALLDVPLTTAAQNVVPVATTAAESVERLRKWSSGRCLDANRPGLFVHGAGPSGQRRRVQRDPSAN